MGPHVTESLSAYMDGELAPPEREAVAAHVRGCPSCARHLEELRAVDAAARELPLAVPDGYFEAFRGSLRRRLQGARPARRRLAPAWALAAAAAVVLAVLTPRLVRDTRAPADSAAHAVHAPSMPAPTPGAPMQRDGRAADAAAEVPRTEPPPPARPAGSRLEKRTVEEQRAPATLPTVAPAGPAPATPAQNAAAAPAARAETAEPEKKDADAPRTLGYATEPAQDLMERARAPQAAKEETEAESTVAGRADEAKARRKTAVGALEATGGQGRFQLLARRTVSSAPEARSLRDAWRAFARDEAAGPHADEARVRAIEAGAEAWRRGRDESDRAETLKDGRAYLERPDAVQADRVRAVLRSLER